MQQTFYDNFHIISFVATRNKRCYNSFHITSLALAGHLVIQIQQ